PRIPDGEQIGWSLAARRTFERNEALEESRRVPLNAQGADPVPIFKLKSGRTSKDLRLGPYGYAENAHASYAEFSRLRSQGKIPGTTKYQLPCRDRERLHITSRSRPMSSFRWRGRLCLKRFKRSLPTCRRRILRSNWTSPWRPSTRNISAVPRPGTS